MPAETNGIADFTMKLSTASPNGPAGKAVDLSGTQRMRREDDHCPNVKGGDTKRSRDLVLETEPSRLKSLALI